MLIPEVGLFLALSLNLHLATFQRFNLLSFFLVVSSLSLQNNEIFTTEHEATLKLESAERGTAILAAKIRTKEYQKQKQPWYCSRRWEA